MGWLADLKLWQAAKRKNQAIAAMAIGMNSSVDITRNLHLLFLDYDVKERKLVEESVRELQEFWKLSDAYIYRTKKGFHVFFFYDIMPYERVRMIVDYAKFVDPMFKDISRFYGHKTIRASGKYAERDIFFETMIPGRRIPTPEESELGQLKFEEHKLLLQQWMQQKGEGGPI